MLTFVIALFSVSFKRRLFRWSLCALAELGFSFHRQTRITRLRLSTHRFPVAEFQTFGRFLIE